MDGMGFLVIMNDGGVYKANDLKDVEGVEDSLIIINIDTMQTYNIVKNDWEDIEDINFA